MVHAALILPPAAHDLSVSDMLRDARAAVAAASAQEEQAARAALQRRRGVLRHKLAADILSQQLRRKQDPSIAHEVPAHVCDGAFAVDALATWQSGGKSAALLLVDERRFRPDQATGALVPDGMLELMSAALRARGVPLMLAMQRHDDGTLKSPEELALAVGQQLVAVQAPVNGEALPKADYLAAIPLMAQHARTFCGGSLPAAAAEVAFAQLANAGGEALAPAFVDSVLALAELRVNVPAALRSKLAAVLDGHAQRVSAAEFVAAFDAAARLGIPGKHGINTAMNRVHAHAPTRFSHNGGAPALHALRILSRFAAAPPERAAATLAEALPQAAAGMSGATAAACLWHSAAIAHAAAQQTALARHSAAETATGAQVSDCTHVLRPLDAACLYHRLADVAGTLGSVHRQEVWAAAQVLPPPEDSAVQRLVQHCSHHGDHAELPAQTQSHMQLAACLRELLPQHVTCQVRTSAPTLQCASCAMLGAVVPVCTKGQ